MVTFASPLRDRQGFPPALADVAGRARPGARCVWEKPLVVAWRFVRRVVGMQEVYGWERRDCGLQGTGYRGQPATARRGLVRCGAASQAYDADCGSDRAITTPEPERMEGSPWCTEARLCWGSPRRRREGGLREFPAANSFAPARRGDGPISNQHHSPGLGRRVAGADPQSAESNPIAAGEPRPRGPTTARRGASMRATAAAAG
jgi:hypothetical protein